MPASVPRLITWRSGSMIGAPDMLPLSLRKAITDPEKVIAPIATPSPISIRLTWWMMPSAPAMPNASGLRNAAAATSTAAMPTREWNAATSCGIAVIAIRRAVTRPITAPIAIAIRISGRLATSWMNRVVPTAIAMPIMPKRLPVRLLTGLESPRSARMKQTPAIR